MLLKSSSLKFSWCKSKYLHIWCQRFMLRSNSQLGPKESSSDRDDGNYCIQPDVLAAVSKTLQQCQAVEGTPILKIPKFNSSLKKKHYPDMGQPTPFTHPHLFESEDETTPGIEHKEYTQRRHKLMKTLSETNHGKRFENHLVLLSANTLKTMSNDIPYPFHQDVDFLYLTGVNEPDAMLALEYNRASDRTTFLLFVKPSNPKRVLWDGAVIGEIGAVDYFKADEAFPISSFDTVITDRFNNGKYCIWCKQNDKDKMRNDSTILNIVRSTDFNKAGQHSIDYNLQLLRLIKSDAEATLMKKSASISSEAFVQVMQSTKVGLPESHLHALLDFECRIRGAQYLSFPPVVAGGGRANTLHYINNNDILGDNDLVLMDGGCEYNGYASDMTRTWPVNGKYTQPQQELYQIVFNVQKTCLSYCKPGVSLDQLYHLMLLTLGKQLQANGFIAQNEPERQLKEIAREYCPHHLGHYLGMDTHDTPLIHRGFPLQAGVAFTLEPGLYIPENAGHVPRRYRGIGIRIEDDILMTNSGPYVLTAGLPKELNDVETVLSRYKNM